MTSQQELFETFVQKLGDFRYLRTVAEPTLGEAHWLINKGATYLACLVKGKVRIYKHSEDYGLWEMELASKAVDLHFKTFSAKYIHRHKFIKDFLADD
jgi:hypothetical protein